MGAHPMRKDGQDGMLFVVWAPNARHVNVIGDFNGWNPKANELHARWDSSGIWEGFVPGVQHGACYKYRIESQHAGYWVEKADPYARWSEVAPATASRV